MTIKKPASDEYIGIKIGHDAKAIENIASVIMEILNSPNAEAVKITALTTLKDSTSITNCSVSNCNFEIAARTDERVKKPTTGVTSR